DSTISGYRRTKGWANDQHIYFYAVFSKPFTRFGIAHNDKHQPMQTFAQGGSIVAWLDYSTNTNESILVKVGISAVDVAGAKNNLSAEVPHWDFDKQRNLARESWNSELNKISVDGKSERDKTIFYTALYHTLLAPNLYSDVDGRYRGHDRQIHLSQNNAYTVFSLWDTFRALHPLLNLIEPTRSSEMIRHMLDIYDKGGLLPVWELAANETQCMIGYHAVPVIADAWRAGISDFDQHKALKAMVKSARQKLHGLDAYQHLGFIPADHESESVSKTLEYAYDDWCIAELARALGYNDLADTFYLRAQHYKNLYDPQTQFFRGRQNGGFIDPFDPAQVNFMLTEANSWQYNFLVPQDVEGHIALMGGENAYAEMLDSLFRGKTELTGRQQADITGLVGQYAHGNEPSHHMAYLYNFVGQPHKTQDLVRQIIDELYRDAPDGLSGNEDCGQMSAWYVFSAMGFYPVTPGSGNYIIGVPRFEKAIMHLENGNEFQIKATGLSKENPYIRQVTLNGKNYSKSFITFEDIAAGGVLEFFMGDEPGNDFGIAPESRPKQKIDGQQLTAVPLIQADSKTFTNQIEVKMIHQHPDAKIFFTTDNTQPNSDSRVFTEVITLDKTTTINAYAMVDGVLSTVVTADFYRIPSGRSIELHTQYSPQYHAGGEIALIDRQRGQADFRTGSWQGYHGVDLSATVDLGKNQKLNKVSIGFLQDERSWIFMPEWIAFEFSMDGKNFEKTDRINNTVSVYHSGSLIKEFELKIKDQTARYVKVYAKNRAICPAGHVGAGEPAWIFADEIVIE
ncbi:MAG TPA: GH92 family glycosyl hydrolase, partial [Bacteroidales bacterium]|nr:GH92 family glycosyl hydrolase [Bacteroidales bacterium]